MFCANNSSQITLDDPTLKLPKYLRKILENSWAASFYQYIFKNINEERFSVLYSNEVSRPNSPVNVIIGLLILKENFQLPDEELIGSLNFDLRYQYALGTTQCEKQPVSINTLTNFRNRLVDYQNREKRDLIKEEIQSLSEHLQTEMKIDGKLLRMDSMMISSSCKKLSRIELVYTINSNVIKAINKINPAFVPQELRCYLEDGNKNETIYRMRDKDATKKLQWLISHALLLQNTCKEIGESIKETDAYKHLIRLIEEQTKETEDGIVVAKAGSELTSQILQNPSDPDATYREKYQGNIGYVANIVESFNDDAGVITMYDVQPNTYSDTKFSKDVINQLGKNEEVTLLTDGAYYSDEIDQTAKENGIDLKPGQLVGKAPKEDKLAYGSFEVDETSGKITACPNKEIPQMSYYSSKSHTAKFKNEQCENCPLKSQCPVKKEKRGYSVKFSSKSYRNSKLRAEMKTKEYIQLTNKRAGIEGIPSVIRRKYQVDTMPVRGLLRTKLWFGFKIAAYNFNKLLKYIKKGCMFIFEENIAILIILLFGENSKFRFINTISHNLTTKNMGVFVS